MPARSLVRRALPLIGALLVASVSGASEAAPDGAALLSRAQKMEADLLANPAKLRFRHHSEWLIRRWNRAVEGNHGAARLEALRGALKASKRLAHWSGHPKDKAQVAALSAQLEEQERALAKAVPSEATPKASVADASVEAKAAPSDGPAWLEKVVVEVEGERASLVLPVQRPLRATRRVIEAHDERGARVYFDVSPVVAALPALGVVDVDHASVARFRVGQHDAKTIRIVLDIQPGHALPEIARFEAGATPRILIGPEHTDEHDHDHGDDDPEALLRDLGLAMKSVSVEAPGDDDNDALRAIVAEIRREAGLEPEPKAADAAPESSSADPVQASPTQEKKPAAKKPAAKKPAAKKPAAKVAASTAPKVRSEPPADLRRKLKKSTLRAIQPRREGLVKIRRIVVDAGHGGKDTGAIGANGTYEKDVNLAIALELGRALRKELGVKVIYTRRKDVFLSLARRVQIANRASADLFISVHANANRNRRIHGIETYYLNTTTSRYATRLARRENAHRFDASHVNSEPPTKGAKASGDTGLPSGPIGRDLQLLLADLAMRSASDQSRRLAGFIQSSTVGSLRRKHKGVKDLGVKHALFYVLLGARMPSVLVESGFMTHRKEVKRLSDARYQKQLARAIANGVKRYVRERNEVASRL